MLCGCHRQAAEDLGRCVWVLGGGGSVSRTGRECCVGVACRM